MAAMDERNEKLLGGSYCDYRCRSICSIVVASLRNLAIVPSGLLTRPANNCSFTPRVKERAIFCYSRISSPEQPRHVLNEHGDTVIWSLIPGIEGTFCLLFPVSNSVGLSWLATKFLPGSQASFMVFRPGARRVLEGDVDIAELSVVVSSLTLATRL